MRKEKILLIILLIIAVSLIPACQSAVDGESASYGALPDTIERLRVLRNADCGFTAWDTYDGEEGSIRFILETAEIKK